MAKNLEFIVTRANEPSKEAITRFTKEFYDLMVKNGKLLKKNYNSVEVDK